MSECERCIGNHNGECVIERCRGMVFSIYLSRATSREERRNYYEAIRSTFEEDFEPAINKGVDDNGTLH